jgi:Protein of unknown function (DUF1579)
MRMLALTVVCSLFAFCPPIAQAQESEKPAQQPAAPTPGPEHAVLKRFTGTWDVAVKMWEKPGAEPMTMQATDESKLGCNGLWLLTSVHNVGGQPFEGMAITGYDTAQKKYVSVWVESMSAPPAWSEGEFDSKTDTLTTHGDMPTPAGTVKVRSTTEFTDADARIEKQWTTDAEGKEFQSLELTFTRHKDSGGKPTDATADGGKQDPAPADPKDPMHQHLTQAAGTWDAKVSMEMPGVPKNESAMQQVDTLICNGLWLHTNATGSFDGTPFEGHGLVGYDTNKKQFVSYWVDGMSTGFTKSAGSYDTDSKTFTLRGEGPGMDGKPMTTEETTSYEGADSRTMVMKSKTADGQDAGTLTIHYTKKQ